MTRVTRAVWLGPAILLVLCGALTWLITTEAGLRLCWRAAVPLTQRLAGIELKADHIAGRLLGAVTVQGFTYLDPGLEISVAQAQVNWQPWEILSSHIAIDAITADKVSVTLRENTTPNEESSNDTTLPITISIENATIAHTVFRSAADSEPLVLTDTRAGLQIKEDRIVIEQFNSSLLGVKGTAEGFISWHGKFPLALQASLTKSLPDNSIMQSDIEAAGNLDEFNLKLTTQAPHSSELRMTWLKVDEGYDLTVKGPLEPAPLLVALEQLPLEALALGAIHIDAQGRLNAEGFQAQRLQINHHDSQLNAEGHIRWDGPAITWSAQTRWKGLALPPWQPELFSESGQARVSGNLNAGESQVDAAYAVKDQPPGQALLVIHWQGSQVTLNNGLLKAGDSEVIAEGNIWPQADLSWSVNSPNLAELWPAATGQLKGEGRVSGDWLAPRIEGQMKGQKIALATVKLDQLSLDADLNLEQDSPAHLVANAEGLQIGDLEPAKLSAQLKGKRSAHTLNLQWNQALLSGQLQTTGGWAGGQAPWLGRLQTLSLKPADHPTWTLTSATNISLHPDSLKLDESCLAQGTSRLCLQGDKNGEPWQGQAQLTDFPLDLLGEWLPDGLKIQGLINGQASANGQSSDWTSLEAKAQTKAIVSRPDVAGTLALNVPQLELTARPDSWQAMLDMRVNDEGHLKASATARPASQDWKNAPLQGKLEIDIPRLKTLSLIAPEIEQLRGKIKGDIRASGTLSQPVFGGNLALEKGQLDLRDYGVSLTPLTVTLSGNPGGALNIDLAATSGGGNLNASGQLKTDLQSPALSMSIKGERFLASQTDEATLYISPDLDLAIRNRQIELNGELKIPEARLRPGQQQSSAQTVSSDQVLVSEEAAQARESLWKLVARVRLILGDKVYFNGIGVDTRLTGQLDIRENPGKRTIANGQIRLVDGVYEVYGQKLAIDTGRLIFANAPVTEPALDIKASRTPDPGVTVGVRVRGLIDAPELSLFSTPSMRQAEQLSYLVLGRPLQGNEGNSALTDAAFALGLTRGDQYVKGLRDNLNVDDVGIETGPGESADRASLVVGKYLSPRLYVSYGAGLFENLHKLRMRYRMSEHWTLVGESGTAQGADILYTIERE